MIKLHIPNMSCGHCRKAIEGAVETVDQKATVEFDMESRHATVESSAETAVFIDALTEAGYTATVV